METLKETMKKYEELYKDMLLNVHTDKFVGICIALNFIEQSFRDAGLCIYMEATMDGLEATVHQWAPATKNAHSRFTAHELEQIQRRRGND